MMAPSTPRRSGAASACGCDAAASFKDQNYEQTVVLFFGYGNTQGGAPYSIRCCRYLLLPKYHYRGDFLAGGATSILCM
jgi:hypothetical protein